jgi:hypothetical protein
MDEEEAKRVGHSIKQYERVEKVGFTPDFQGGYLAQVTLKDGTILTAKSFEDWEYRIRAIEMTDELNDE